MSEEKKKNKKNNEEEREYVNPVMVFLKIVWGIISFAIRTAFVAVLIAGCVVAGLLIGVVTACVTTTEPLSEIQLTTSKLSTFLYYDDGTPITYTTEDGSEEVLALKGTDNVNRVLVSYDQIPENLSNAFIAIEDERFRSHNGVDIKRTASAVVAYVVPGLGDFGGSTITQQLVKNASGDDSRSIPRKIREAWRAYMLEKDYSKDEILEKYMNIIYMGRNLYGVQSAAQAYFGKDVSELNLAECAYMAGITNNPSKYGPTTTRGRQNGYKRQITILDKMLELEMITQDEYIEAIQYEIVFNEDYETTTGTATFSYFVDKVIKDVRVKLVEAGYTSEEAVNLIYGGGIHIYTTQNKDMQAILDKEFNDDENFKVNDQYTSDKDKAQAAMVVIDQYTGQIKAMYGGYGEKTVNLSWNYATDAKRQPGSSIKPILIYGPLIDQHIITAADTLEDVEVFLDPDDPEKPWPSNSYKYYMGTMSVRYALAKSCNVVAVLLYKDHINLCLNYLKKSGIDRTQETQLATGVGGLTEGVCALDMAAAYVPFANGTGIYYEPTTFTKILDSNGNTIYDVTPESHLVYEDPQTPAVMTSLLTSVLDYHYSGTGTRAIIYKDSGEKVPVAGKTGTTNDYYDYWFVGYTGYYTAACWYGYPSYKTMASAEYGAAQIIWQKVMKQIHEDLPIKELCSEGTPAATYDICSESRKLATDLCRECGCVETESFISGTQPTTYCTSHKKYTVCADCGATEDGEYYLAGDNCKNKTTVVTSQDKILGTCNKCKSEEDEE